MADRTMPPELMKKVDILISRLSHYMSMLNESHGQGRKDYENAAEEVEKEIDEILWNTKENSLNYAIPIHASKELTHYMRRLIQEHSKPKAESTTPAAESPIETLSKKIKAQEKEVAFQERILRLVEEDLKMKQRNLSVNREYLAKLKSELQTLRDIAP